MNEVLVKGDGKVIPLTQQQETEVKEMLSRGQSCPWLRPSLQRSLRRALHRWILQGTGETVETLVVPPEPPPPPVQKLEQQISDWMSEGSNPFAETERPVLAELVEEPKENESSMILLPPLYTIVFFLVRALARSLFSVIRSMFYGLFVSPAREVDRILLALVERRTRSCIISSAFC